MIGARRSSTALLSLALTLALAGCGTSDEDAIRPLPREFFGVNGQLLLQAETTVPGDPAVDASLASIERLGIGFVRANLIWPEIEPSGPVNGGRQYSLAGLDAWVGALARHGLRWQALLMGIPTPAWAAQDPTCGPNSAPAKAGDLAALAGAVAARYGRGGTFWRDSPQVPYLPVTDYEVWNEPNLGVFWCPAPAPEPYARLYLATRARIRATDPRANVIVGGLANIGQTSPPKTPLPNMAAGEFISRMLASRPALRDAIDAVAVHPYAADSTGALASVAAFRALLDREGLSGVPISVDEIGWPTQGDAAGPIPAVREEVRAGYVREVTRGIAAAACGVIAFAPHTWTSPEAIPTDREHWFGIANPMSGEPYPTAIAYAEEIEALTDGEPSEVQSAKLPPCESDS